MNRSLPCRHQVGFTLLEAMVALLVVAFGMLALVGMQARLSHSSDVAMQRSIGTRLAQERIEEMRSFDTTSGTGPNSWSTVVTAGSAPDKVIGNATYRRSWTVGGTTADKMRPVHVLVTWIGRDQSEPQSVTLDTVISKTSPSDSGLLAFPQPSITKRPRNRNINIPVPALDLGGGKSAYKINPTLAVVFSNTSGYVVERCTSLVAAVDYTNGAAGCTSYNAYIVAGYVSGSIRTDFGIPTRPTGINTSALSGWDDSLGKAVSCIYQVARNQNTDLVIPGYHYYLCVVPVAANGTWSGTIRLGGVPTNASYKVCRFEYAKDDFTSRNERNVQPYANVNASIDNQNYYIDTSAGASCPTVGGLPTELHQDCRSDGSPSTANTSDPTVPMKACPLSIYNTLESPSPA